MNNEPQLEDFDELLNADPLGMAEEVTGCSYKEDEDTQLLGMLLHMAHGRQVREELALRGDTYHSMPWAEFLEVAERAGFQEVSSEEFTEKGFGLGARDTQEVHVLFWRRGLLLEADSYHGILNSARVHFVAEFKESGDAFKLSLSGHYLLEEYDRGRYLWVGDMHVSEALLHHLAKLEELSTPLEVWPERPYHFLVNRECYKQVDELPWKEQASKLEELTEERLSKLPEEVRAAVAAPKKSKRG